jgi:hypothetical protein
MMGGGEMEVWRCLRENKMEMEGERTLRCYRKWGEREGKVT